MIKKFGVFLFGLLLLLQLSTTQIQAQSNVKNELEVCLSFDVNGNCVQSSNSFITDVFGGNQWLTLKVFNPVNFEGEANFFVYISMFIEALFVILFLAFIGAVLFGTIKWFASGGDQGKIQAAQKWLKNALIGVAVTIAAFALVNILAFVFRIGNVFSLAENFAVCEDNAGDKEALYQYKRDQKLLTRDVSCSCGNGWDCN